jgi:hypothetical protein
VSERMACDIRIGGPIALWQINHVLEMESWDETVSITEDVEPGPDAEIRLQYYEAVYGRMEDVEDWLMTQNISFDRYPITGKDMDAKIKALRACGIEDRDELFNTHTALVPLLWKRSEEEQHERDVQLSRLKCRQNMPFQEYESSPKIAGRMVVAAKIEAGQTILEPSAGIGALADAILLWERNVTLHVVEKVPSMQAHLALAGYDVVPIDDFLTADFALSYDRILMAPPWDKGADMEHVMKAADLVTPGGRLVALVSQQSFDRKDHKGKRYREWVQNTGTKATAIDTKDFAKMSGTTGVILIYDRGVL